MEVIWDGCGPLTEWPEVDWAIVLRADWGYEPIWDQQPLTAAFLWTKRMGTRCHNPHDDHRSFLRAKPELVDLDRQKHLGDHWACITKMLGLLSDPKPVAALPVVEQTPQQPGTPATIDAALEEIRQVEIAQTALGRAEAVLLCAHSNKVKHRSKLWALHHRNRLAASLDELHPDQLEVYKCRWCGSWHVGQNA